MNAPLQKPWTQERFLSWAEAQDERYEFDGLLPVAMTGGTLAHSVITQNVHAALRARLRGGSCRPLGPDAAVATVGNALRFPDALVTCAKLDLAARIVPDPVIVFEVLSASTSRTDRIDKVREYAAVASIRRYVILESTSVGLTVMSRATADESWRVTVLTKDDVLQLPEIGVEIPVGSFYEDVEPEAGPLT
jgi:Uma2 family endonuclease